MAEVFTLQASSAPSSMHFTCPGGIASGQPTAWMDPFILRENVPSHMPPKFKDSCFRMADKWTCFIQEAMLYNEVVDDGIDKEEKANEEEPLGQNEEEEDREEELSTIGSKVDEGEEEEVFDFKWETPLKGLETDWAPTASAHCKALKMLGTILASTTKLSLVEMRSLERVIRRIGGESQDIKMQLGNIQHLIQEHGSLADTVQATLTADSFVQDDLTTLREDIDTFSKQLQEFASFAKVSSETVLTIIARIQDKANTHHQEIKIWMKQLETALGQTYQPPSPPPTQRTLSTSLMQGGAPEFDDDTALEIAFVGCETVITANYLFGLIQDLQEAKVDVLTERSKNMGVIFQQVAFSSEAEFTYWYVLMNALGSGLMVFVDLVSIWTLASGNQVDTSKFLNEIHCSNSVGLKGGNVDVVYAHSMSQRYPTCFVGKDKNVILSTMTIKILES
jgi:hypothetical protein